MSKNIIIPNPETNDNLEPTNSSPSNLSNEYTNISLTGEFSTDIESNIKDSANDICNNTIQQKPTINSQQNSECCGCLVVMLGVLFAIGLLGLGITYIVYVIISLCRTSYKEQKDMCEESNVWLYLLLSLIIGTMVNSSSAKSKVKSSTSSSKNKSNVPVLVQVVCMLAFTIWGCVELFKVKCVGELKSTLLYTMLEISVISNLALLSVVVVACLFLCFINCWSISKQTTLN
jgi:hypothetical protein